MIAGMLVFAGFLIYTIFENGVSDEN